MTGIQELQDEILGIEAFLHGKRLELALAQGEKETARQHMHAMYSATQKQRDFRIACEEQGGGCFFLAAGAADQVKERAHA